MTSIPVRYLREAELLGVLAHPLRLQILDLLRTEEACVCDLQTALRQRQACVSQHLMALRDAGLVTSRKQGLRVYYQLRDPKILSVLDEVQALSRGK